MVRLELTRVSPPPPQDGVSTNFTTSAVLASRSFRLYCRSRVFLFRILAILRIRGRRRSFGRLARRRFGGLARRPDPPGRLLGLAPFHDAAALPFVARHIGEPHARQKEHRG